MRRSMMSLIVLALLCACQTASYKQTSALAGTSWNASGPSTDPAYSFPELQFGAKLSPSGMGQVRLAPGNGNIALFQVIDGILLIRVNDENRKFDFDLDGDTLTITHLSDSGQKLGTQTFKRLP